MNKEKKRPERPFLLILAKNSGVILTKTASCGIVFRSSEWANRTYFGLYKGKNSILKSWFINEEDMDESALRWGSHRPRCGRGVFAAPWVLRRAALGLRARGDWEAPAPPRRAAARLGPGVRTRAAQPGAPQSGRCKLKPRARRAPCAAGPRLQ